MLRLDPTTGTFTSIHLDFLRLCMDSRSYAAAQPILDNYIHSIPSKIPDQVRQGLEYSVPCADVAASGDYIHLASGHSGKVTLADLQEYYLMGAMAYLGTRKFKKAQQLLEHVLVVPSGHVANGLMLEAYKKWVLVSCLVNATVCDACQNNHREPSDMPQDRAIPRTANANAIKQVKSASKAYEALAEAYTQLGNMSKLKVQVKYGTEIWAEVSWWMCKLVQQALIQNLGW
jgi:COP9 signalosome complex subunit 3